MTDKEFKNVAHTLEQQFKQNPGMQKDGIRAFLKDTYGLFGNDYKLFTRRYLKEGQDENLKVALIREVSKT